MNHLWPSLGVLLLLISPASAAVAGMGSEGEAERVTAATVAAPVSAAGLETGSVVWMGEATDLIGACPYDVARPDLLCDGVIGLISSRKKPYRYAYEQTILEAACVRTRDRPEEVRRKVQELWIRNEDRLTCNTAQFPIINGSIIKAGLNSEFDPFVTDLLQWGVPLNRVDEDGKTALDFLADQRVRYQGTSAERKFRRYYERFREAGAKHAREL